MYPDLMIDLETLGTDPNGLIVQIGACYFDRYNGKVGPTFCKNIDIQSGIDEGFTMTGSTIEWWLTQSPEAQKSIMAEPKVNVVDAMLAFNNFAQPAKAIWSHATFDFVLVSYHLSKLGIRPKFGFWTARDLRTIIDLAKVDVRNIKREGLHHNALDDCIAQVKQVVVCLSVLNKKERPPRF